MVYDKVVELLAEQLGVDEDSITPDTNIVDDLGAASMDVVELIQSLEDTFNILISDDRIRKCFTVKELSDFLEAETDKRN